jgi:hypothetical protein
VQRIEAAGVVARGVSANLVTFNERHPSAQARGEVRRKCARDSATDHDDAGTSASPALPIALLRINHASP